MGIFLNMYAVLLVISIVAVDLAREHTNLYTKVSRDGLTGLYTHSFFKNELIDIISEISDSKEAVSMMLLDIDFFKKVNDTYGHLAGDKVLKSVADIIQATIPKEAIAARYAREEFALILKNFDETNALAAAEQMRICTFQKITAETRVLIIGL